MKVSTQRFVDRWIGVPLCAALTLMHWIHSKFAPARRSSPAVTNIMVVLLSEMGSLVLAYPMLTWLRQQHPQATIHALMFARNREVIELLDLDGNIVVTTVRDTGFFALIKDSIAAIRFMRNAPIDIVLDCELFSRVSAIFCALSGARERVGFHRHTQEGLYRGDFFTQPVLYNPHRHIADQFLALAAGVGSAATPSGKDCLAPAASSFRLPKLQTNNAELASVRLKLHGLAPVLSSRKLALIYASGGALPIRAWPLNHFKDLAQQWIANGYAVGVIGLPTDVDQATELVSAVSSPHCFSLAGQTKNVRELILMFHFATVLVANDGGPGHFAVLADLPAVMLFGPETPRLYGSLSARVLPIHRAEMPCSPCLTAFNHRLSPCDGDNQCLKRISPSEVAILARTAVGTESRAIAAT